MRASTAMEGKYYGRMIVKSVTHNHVDDGEGMIDGGTATKVAEAA